jgi:hypothetical protein
MESTVRMGFLQGITSSGTSNPPKEYDSAGNNQLMEAESNPIYGKSQLLKN